MILTPLWPLLAAVVVVLALHLWASRGSLRSGSAWRRLCILLLLGAVALQPAIAGSDEPPAPTATDVVIVLDRTTSMGAQDWDGQRPRMDGVAADVSALVAAMPSARYSVVVMDNDARISVPWTTDTTALVTFAETVGWREESFGIGSDISVGKPVAEQLLEDSSRSRPQARRFLVYLGDGEQTMEAVPASFDTLAPLLTGAMVLGYGTQQGGVMALRPDTDELVERDGVAQLSHINETTLQRIADELGGTYYHRTTPGGLQFWADGAGAASGETGTPDYSLAWLLAIGAAALLSVDGWFTIRQARRAHREARA
ncbi:vWA domain-containing protein [Tessaracoccus antarcticus]|uniref:VWA domain-containing protein n=1 Tax=Tessaracoccus antarcticus TaxID=2479848 RepID=A0A3M0GM09_9ACTN|nr:VWA domain-containing protein [Tessaracoccus antarcticus]RMB58336.1 VWA domain-containing protein [Tessaracoccus antarcticus]